MLTAVILQKLSTSPITIFTLNSYSVFARNSSINMLVADTLTSRDLCDPVEGAYWIVYSLSSVTRWFLPREVSVQVKIMEFADNVVALSPMGGA